jgi:hypothetical protein
MDMRRIKQANIVRFTERNDVQSVDVEVKADGIKGVLLAEFTASQDNDFDLRHVYRKDASNEIDWYKVGGTRRIQGRDSYVWIDPQRARRAFSA